VIADAHTANEAAARGARRTQNDARHRSNSEVIANACLARLGMKRQKLQQVDQSTASSNRWIEALGALTGGLRHWELQQVD